MQTLRIGIAGLGRAGRLMIPAIMRHPRCELIAVADPSVSARETYDGPGRVLADIETLASAIDVDAIYVATPTLLHAEHARIAATAGKHVVCEKPMAVTIDDATAMIDAADQAGVTLLIGHSHGFDPPIRKMREIIAGGSLGSLRLLSTLCYTDWVWRPRRPDELDVNAGGGVVFRQGAHQFDVLRLLGGGLIRRVRANVFDWNSERRTAGAHVATLTFTDGVVATVIYNGYGGLLSSELCFGIDELGDSENHLATGAARRRHRDATVEESTRKTERANLSRGTGTPFQPIFGLTIASCERGDIRQSPNGIFIYGEEGRREVQLPSGGSTRDLVLDELCDAVSGIRPAIHDGKWGRANLELCIAATRSSELDRDIELKYQTPINPGSMS